MCGVQNNLKYNNSKHETSTATIIALQRQSTNIKSSGISILHGSHLCYYSEVTSQRPVRVKLNRVFFPRQLAHARSLGCGFARR